MDAALHFPNENRLDNGTYRLLELPPDLVTLLQSNSQHRWTIRGRSGDDAVLCTEDKTYAVRSVLLSNAICVLTPPSTGESGDAVIRESVHEILELQPSIPKLHRLNGLLRGQEYDDAVEQGVSDMDRTRYSCETIRSQVQTSDSELKRGLKERRILTINGELRPIAPGYLNSVLELLLNALISLSLRPESVPVTELIHVLSVDHEVNRSVSLQVMSWFGELHGVEGENHSDATWTIDVVSVVRQMGLGLLNTHRADPLEYDGFMKRWKHAVGESFDGRINLLLLAGNYITIQSSSSRKLKYFPSADLPTAPAERFSDLFLAQSRWKKTDIMPFLNDIALDEKESEKLLMKFTRATAEPDGTVWYTSRGGTMV